MDENSSLKIYFERYFERGAIRRATRTD